MPAEDYRKAYALSLIDKFPPLPKGRPFPRIHLDDVVSGLRERVNDPYKQNQGAASLCGPAVFFYWVLNYKPELYVQCVIDLFTTGKARIGSLKVEPSLPCRVYEPPANKIAAVDWISTASQLLEPAQYKSGILYSVVVVTSGITHLSALLEWPFSLAFPVLPEKVPARKCPRSPPICAPDIKGEGWSKNARTLRRRPSRGWDCSGLTSVRWRRMASP
jgi:hypothetical protein